MERRMNSHSNRLRSIVEVALMAALTYLATALLNIPYAVDGVLHLGDTVIFVSAVLLGKRKAAVASALGMTIFDLLSPYAMWAPFTFVIKGVMGFIAGAIAYRGNFGGKNFANNVFAFASAGIWMTAAYYLSAAAMASTLLMADGVPFSAALVASLPKISGDIIQVVGGMIIALPLVEALKKTPLMTKNKGN